MTQVSRLVLAALPLVTAMAITPAAAAPVIDPAGDFLPTFTGPQNGDLDALAIEVVFNGTQFLFSATLNGPVGTTDGAFYVWGIDRGAGQELFQAGTPPIGAGVLFDSVVVLDPDGDSFFFDILGGTGAAPIAAGAVDVAGNMISAAVPLTLIPSLGLLPPDEYTFNLWPRFGLGENDGVADFLPDASNFAVTIPAPQAAGILGLGFAALFAFRRRAVTSV